jgi:SagB-type dehydrogenase family enzyme
VLRPAEGGFILESALAGRRYPVTSPAVLHLLLALTRPVCLAELLESVELPSREGVLGILGRWREDGVLTTVGEDGHAEEDRGPARAWEFHDLMFHARSRRGRTSQVVGATYPLRGVLPPEPAFPDLPAQPGIDLPRPDLARLEREDPPLTRVLEARRSRYSLAPVTLDALGELLFRTFRVVRVRGAAADPQVLKVYPSAGGLHPLELYVVPWSCEGLERGVWRYRPRDHRLTPVAGLGPDVEALLEEARAGTGAALGGYPPVLLIVSARHGRVAWKYQSLAYAAVLKEVGGLFQTLYLVATAMNLSPCAVGTGDSDRFARVVGADYYRETSVGEFILGGPAGPAEPARPADAGGGGLR